MRRDKFFLLAPKGMLFTRIFCFRQCTGAFISRLYDELSPCAFDRVHRAPSLIINALPKKSFPPLGFA